MRAPEEKAADFGRVADADAAEHSIGHRHRIPRRRPQSDWRHADGRQAMREALRMKRHLKPVTTR
jgi:hypothetical protein